MFQCRFLLCTFFVFKSISAIAQLDTIHWLPPMHARVEWGPQFLYLSTPEQQAFEVNIRDGAGTLIVAVMIDNSSPFVLDLGSSNDTKTLVNETALHKPLSGKGLVIDGPKPFYAYFRTHSNGFRHAGDLTCKGRAALGQTFRIGHLVQAENDMDRRSNFIGILATEDSTEISLSDYDQDTRFRVNSTETFLAAPIRAMLQKGESMVFAQYIQSSTDMQPPNGFMGTLVTATRPIAVNCGSWFGAPVVFTAHDIGIDQIVPVELVGKEYILCKGSGSQVLEHPIVVAHFDNTQVFINGSGTPAKYLGKGEYFSVPTSSYSSEGNMYIRTSEPAYMYQMVGGTSDGDDQYRTAGLIFVPPLSCAISNLVDNIYLPNQIGNMSFQGGMMITAIRDSLVVVSVDGLVVPIGPASTVTGNPDFVTYRPLMMFSQTSTPTLVSVRSQGAVQVGLYGRNDPASFAGFFSGFTREVKPDITLIQLGDGVCPDTLIASGRFDGVQWMYEDSTLQYGSDTMLIVFTPGQYSAVGYLGVCRKNEIAADSVQVGFNAPVFPFVVVEPSCFGFSDGEIEFGLPNGGIPPYQYSVDGGITFSYQPKATQLKAGILELVVRDAIGCYNRPLQWMMEQPDSFAVSIMADNLPNPLYPGEVATFNGVPERPVVRTAWTPLDSTLCSDCLQYTLYARESTWIDLTVVDEAGCPATDRVFVAVTPHVFAPNVLKSDSGEGNQVFTLFSKQDLRVKRLLIFDRWGNLMFEQREFRTNALDSGWDGTFKGKKLDPGVFVWLAEVELLDGVFVNIYGDLTLVR